MHPCRRSRGLGLGLLAGSVPCAALLALALLHGVGLFSVGWIMGEGRATCYSLAAATLLLAACACSKALSAHRTALKGRLPWLLAPLALAAVALACNAALLRYGMIDRSHADPHDKSTPDFQLQGPGVGAAAEAAHPDADAHGAGLKAMAGIAAVAAAAVCLLAAASVMSADLGRRAANARMVLAGFAACSVVVAGAGSQQWSSGHMMSRMGAMVPALLRTQAPAAALLLLLRCVHAALQGAGRPHRRAPPLRALSLPFRALEHCYCLQLPAVACYWLAKFYGFSDTTPQQLAASALWLAQARWAALQDRHPPLAGLLQVILTHGDHGSGWSRLWSMPAVHAAMAWLDQHPAVQLGSAALHGHVWSLPLRLLLPRAVYLPAALAMGHALLQGAVRLGAAVLMPLMGPGQRAARRQHAGRGDAERLPWSGWRVSWSVLSSGACALCMQLGYKGPLMVALGAAQVLALLRLLYLATAPPPLMGQTTASLGRAGEAGQTQSARLQCSAELQQPDEGESWLHNKAAPASPSPIVPPTSAAAQPLRPVTEESVPRVLVERSCAGGLLLCVVGLQLFFTTGHFCEFSGLQYDAPFLGFDAAAWSVSPALLAANTFGAMALTACVLPLWHACIGGAARRAACAASGGTAQACLGGSAAAGNAPIADAMLHAAVAGSWQLALLAYAFGRCASLCCGVLCAAIQMHHIVVWAIFAPKVVFEVGFALSACLACLVAAASYRPL